MDGSSKLDILLTTPQIEPSTGKVAHGAPRVQFHLDPQTWQTNDEGGYPIQNGRTSDGIG